AAAELARERPVGALAVGQDAAEDTGAGRRCGQLVELAVAVEGEEPHALREGVGDVGLLLDGVAEGDALAGHAGGEAEIDLAAAGDVEAGAELGQLGDDLRR